MAANQSITYFGCYSCFHGALQGDSDAEGAGIYYQSDPVNVALLALENFCNSPHSFISAYFSFLEKPQAIEHFQSGVETAIVEINQQLRLGSKIGFQTNNIDQRLEKILQGLTVSTIAIALEFFEELMQRDISGNVLRNFAQKIQTKKDLENLISLLEGIDPNSSPAIEFIRDLKIEKIESCRDVLNRIIPIAIAIIKKSQSPSYIVVHSPADVEEARLQALKKILLIGGVAKLIFDYLIAIRDVNR